MFGFFSSPSKTNLIKRKGCISVTGSIMNTVNDHSRTDFIQPADVGVKTLCFQRRGELNAVAIRDEYFTAKDADIGTWKILREDGVLMEQTCSRDSSEKINCKENEIKRPPPHKALEILFALYKNTILRPGHRDDSNARLAAFFSKKMLYIGALREKMGLE